MRKPTRFPRILPTACLIALALGQAPFASAQAKAEEEDAHAADRSAIRKATQSFIKAFEAGDARALAAHWTAGGEYVGGDGTVLRGREAIEKGYAERFARKEERKVEIESETIRFPSRDTAIEEGFLKVRVGKEEPAGSRYSVLHVREDGQWRMAVVRDWPAEAVSLRDLDWLIGSWVAKREDAEVRTTYAWMWEKSFIRVQFTIKQPDRTLSGFQLIGKDPATGQLRSWTFEANGGFGEAHWSRDGKKWVLDSAGVLADGSTLAAQILMTPLDADSFVSHVTNRTLDGEELGDLPPVKVTRVKDKP